MSVKSLNELELKEYNKYLKMTLKDLQKVGKFKRFKLLHTRIKESE